MAPMAPRKLTANFSAVLDALASCIEHAPTEQMQALAEALENYEKNNARSLNSLCKAPAFKTLWEVMRDESGAGIGNEG